MARAILSTGALPPFAERDALHIAVANYYCMDVLLTWNCKHIANLEIQGRFAHVLTEQGFRLPALVTPELFLGANK
jgi:hypothetical protein